MLSSLKAKEIATIKSIEDKIRDASLKGDFKISLSELSDDAKNILILNGYTISTISSENITRYDINWDI